MLANRAATRNLCRASAPRSHLLTLDGLLGLKAKFLQDLQRIPGMSHVVTAPENRAAVLVPVCADRDGRLSLLYTLRSSKLKSHSGHVSFPGGRCDPEDASLTDTALRETEEELGVPRGRVEVWGEFGAAYPSRNYDTAVTPVVGLIRRFDDLRLAPSEDEVEAVFAVPLERLCDRRYFGRQEFEYGFVLPVFEGGEHRIWGLTAVITHIFLSCLLPESVYEMRYELLNEMFEGGKSAPGPSKL